MKNLNKIIIGILILIILLSVMAIIVIGNYTSSSPQQAIIKLNGEIINTLDLTTLTEPVTFTVENGQGGINTIHAEKGKIAIIEANCPDQLCVERGYITNSLLPSVCLPNGLIIEIQDQTSNDENLDIIAE